MKTLLVGACLATALLLMTSSAFASHDPSGQPFDEDFVTGIATVTSISPSEGCHLSCYGLRLDAHSGPSGENAFGSTLLAQRLFSSGGPVSCLAVTGRRAVIGGPDTEFTGSAYLFLVEDNAATGTPDRLLSTYTPLLGAPIVCPSPDEFVADTDRRPYTVVEGDLVVHDAGPPVPTSKDQCKGYSWRNFPGFKNQGSCISFLNH
jgi:hypothetical protein